MIPPDPASDRYRAAQSEIIESIARALEKSGVKHAVTLSSFGADKPDKTGPIAGLHEMETRLNQIEGLNVFHLRPGDFMGNTLPQITALPNFVLMPGPLHTPAPPPL